jgi:hypothetical protein
MTKQSEKMLKLINHVNSNHAKSRTSYTECPLATDPGRSDKAKLGPTMHYHTNFLSIAHFQILMNGTTVIPTKNSLCTNDLLLPQYFYLVINWLLNKSYHGTPKYWCLWTTGTVKSMKNITDMNSAFHFQCQVPTYCRCSFGYIPDVRFCCADVSETSIGSIF